MQLITVVLSLINRESNFVSFYWLQQAAQRSRCPAAGRLQNFSAMQDLHRFVPRTGERDFLHISARDRGCYAYDRYQPGRGQHEINLDPASCLVSTQLLHFVTSVVFPF